MLDNVQIIKDKDQARFAVIAYDEFETIKALLSNPEKLEDYLDYLHMQQIKKNAPVRVSLADVKRELAVD